MLRARWRTSIRPPFIPPLLVMGTAALISLAAAQLVAAAPLLRTPAAADCSTAGAAARAMARHSAAAPSVTQNLNARGEFTGRGLGIAGRATLALPVDSFVGQPVGDSLVYTVSTSGRSEIHVVDMGAGCDTIVARTPGVARSAVLDLAGGSVYVHSVTFPARADAGVTRYALDGSSAVQVVPSLSDNSRFGLNFATQLGWSSDGATLFVQSCGAAQCRTRLLDAASGAIATYDDDGQGPIIGVSATHIDTYEACGGLPCAVLSIDRASHVTTRLVNDAWTTAFDATNAGNAVVRIQTAAGIVEVAQ